MANGVTYGLNFPFRDSRRGDYLELRQKHPEVTVEWYEKAMSMFPDCKFKFFSDDIAWCQ